MHLLYGRYSIAAHPRCKDGFTGRSLSSANAVVGQILFGTKLKQEKTPYTGIERTNILTLIDRAEKLSENPGME
jgi:hypothetical protein